MAEEREAAGRAPVYAVKAVMLAGLGHLQPLLVEYAATPAGSEVRPEHAQFMLQIRTADPLAVLLMVTRDEEPVGFLGAQLVVTPMSREVFILLAYIRPAAGMRAGRALSDAVQGWARALKATRVGFRTPRIHGEEPAEEHAWLRRYGFTADSVLFYRNV